MRASIWSLVLSLLLGASVAANIEDFVEIESTERYRYALRRSPSAANLQEIALSAQDRVMGGAFHLPAVIYQLSNGGARVTTFPGVDLRTDILRGLGVVSELNIGEHDPDLSSGEADQLNAWVVREGEDRNAGPFVIAAQEPPVHHFVMLRHENVLYVVDARLLPLVGRSE